MKEDLGRRNCLYPMPAVLVGSLVEGRSNFATVAHVGIADFDSISISLGRTHHTVAGIRENGTFSVNIPSMEQVELVDYCGLVSGREVDKGGKFSIFFGELRTAPLIEECPINMECRVAQTIEMPKHTVFIGSIMRTHCDTQLLIDGRVDMERLRPVLFSMEDKGYWTMGRRIADAWKVGRKLMD